MAVTYFSAVAELIYRI